MCYLMIVCVAWQPEDGNFADQKTVYKDIGEEMLDHAFEGNFLDDEMAVLTVSIIVPKIEQVTMCASSPTARLVRESRSP